MTQDINSVDYAKWFSSDLKIGLSRLNQIEKQMKIKYHFLISRTHLCEIS